MFIASTTCAIASRPVCRGPCLPIHPSFSNSPIKIASAPRHPCCGDLHLVRSCSLPPTNTDGLLEAGPRDAQPEYTAIDASPLNRLIFSLFRNKMVAALDGNDSPLTGYPAIIDLTRRLNTLGTPRDTQVATRKILKSLFPSWLPAAFSIMFSKPQREFSCRLNAAATWATCQWLMGECEINDVEIDGGGSIGVGHGVLVKRCRYLEDTGCASICINSCKVPTQEFFMQDMGLPLTMEPNYETFECQFSFGRTPAEEAVDEAFTTPCFVGCPTARGRGGGSNCHRIDAAVSASTATVLDGAK